MTGFRQTPQDLRLQRCRVGDGSHGIVSSPLVAQLDFEFVRLAVAQDGKGDLVTRGQGVDRFVEALGVHGGAVEMHDLISSH